MKKELIEVIKFDIPETTKQYSNEESTQILNAPVVLADGSYLTIGVSLLTVKGEDSKQKPIATLYMNKDKKVLAESLPEATPLIPLLQKDLEELLKQPSPKTMIQKERNVASIEESE